MHVRPAFRQYNLPLSFPSSTCPFFPFSSVPIDFFLFLPFTLNHFNAQCLFFPHGPNPSTSSPVIFSYLLSCSSGFSLSSPLFNETVFSYAVIPWPQSSQSYLSFTEFELTFRPSMPDGVLLYSDDAGSEDFLAINLVNRYVEFRFDCGSGGAIIRYLMDPLILICAPFYIPLPLTFSKSRCHMLNVMMCTTGVRSRSVWTHGMS